MQGRAQVIAQHELRGSGEPFGQRDGEVGQKSHERRALVINSSIQGFSFGQIGSEDGVDEGSLLIAEKRPQGVVRFAEAVFHDTYDAGEIGASKRFHRALDDTSISFIILVFHHAAINVVISQMKDAEVQFPRLQCDFRAEPDAADAELRPSRGENLVVFELRVITIDRRLF